MSVSNCASLRVASGRIACTILLAAGAGCSIQGNATRTSERLFLTPIDYVASGRRALEQREADLPSGEVIAECMAATTRIRVTIATDGSEHAATLGTGVVVLDGSRIMTAGHVVSANPEKPVRAVFADGRSRAARLAAHAHDPAGDWAILELSEPPAAGVASAVLGSAGSGELVIVLGYPGGMGTDEQGRTVLGDERKALDPVAFLRRVREAPRMLVEPIAGAVPFASAGGMSGGPVFNLRGELVGLVSGASWDDDQEGPVRYSIAVTPTSTFAGHLEAETLGGVGD